MRAIRLNGPDGAESMEMVDAPPPRPGPGDLLVEVAYGGLNFADLMMRTGVYPHPKGYPLIAGLEIAGRVIGVGEGVADFQPGDRVAGFSEEAGGFAEQCLLPAERAIRVPQAIGLDVAAGFYVQALTAWSMLHVVSETGPGDVVLINAIGGGVGLVATQLAVQAGATVLGTVGTGGKERRALELGAAAVFNRAETDFVAGVMAFTKGRGVDKILDSVGATVLDRSFDAIRKLGHVVSIGEAEGKPLPNLWERLVRKSLTFTRFHLGHSDFQGEAWKRGAASVVERVATGRLTVPIEKIFAFDDAPAMYAALESRRVPGKLLLAINPAI